MAIQQLAQPAVSSCQWTAQYSVNVARLDDQHKKLFEILGSLQQAMMARKGTDVISSIVSELANYTKTHFACEEGYLRMYGYPELEAHKKEHEIFVEKIRQFQNDLAKGQVTLSLNVFRFLVDWLKNHILGTDKKYVPFLQAKGVR
ncbi:MAG: bacteriohemerythrin [Thermoguttaceae bacterium]|nr:bacteriohemerythrin [Thermoguttaceae bacterium]MDW8078376.1 bacteriohemerythrin [Thermoguttaceae bacterium]